MSRMTIFSLMCLIFSISAFAQDSLLSKGQWIHLELAAQLSAGINRPGMNRGHDHTSNTMTHTNGSFYGAGLKGTLGFNWLSVCAEANYTLANYDLDYSTDYSEKTGGTSSNGDYSLDIQKLEFAFYPSLKMGKKQRFSILLGAYICAETSKRISGEYNYYSSWYDPTFVGTGPGPHYTSYSETLHFDNNQLSTATGVGVLTGFGYSIPFKNQTALFFDLRAKVYSVNLMHEEFFRSSDFGINIGYTFFSSKGRKSK